MLRLRKLIPTPLHALELALRLGLGALLLYASWDKLLHPADFAALVKGYRILPDALVNPVAVWLPWAELTLGVCLWTGYFCEGALLLTTLLLVAFWTALWVDFARGLDVACGCFSTAPEDRAPMYYYISRDGFFLAVAIGAAWARRSLLRRERRG